MTDVLDPTDNRTRTLPGRLTLTVGIDGGDFRGADDRVLQAGLDYLHRIGGGTLQVLPGEYRMRNALFLRPGTHLRGAGEATVLRKAASVCTPLSRDTDWYEARLWVADPSGFEPGCGIMLRSTVNGSLQVIKDTVLQVEGRWLNLSRRLAKNAWVDEQATAATLFPILTAEHVDDVCVEDLVLDGNAAENEEVNGNHAGAVFIQHCSRYLFRNVVARGYNGDGFSFQVCDDVRFERCRAEDNANLGFHPGSGSQRPVFDRCTARGNGQGIFFCWGVADGLVTDCTLSANRDYGVSIGHRDTDNRIVGCTIADNGRVGILCRRESAFRSGHRNTVELCTVRDNGADDEGVGIDVQGPVQDLALRGNQLVDTGAGRQRIGIRIGPEARRVELAGNAFTGMAVDTVTVSP